MPYKSLLSNDKPPSQLAKLPGVKLMAKNIWKELALGPKFLDIAERYKATPDAESILAQKVIAGRAGVFGEIPMPPHPLLTQEDVRKTVSAILALNDLPAKAKK